jgi:uncharacterized membrane protein
VSTIGSALEIVGNPQKMLSNAIGYSAVSGSMSAWTMKITHLGISSTPRIGGSVRKYTIFHLYANHRVTGKEREYFANIWRDKAKKKKKVSQNRHYSFTVSNLLPTWTTASFSAGLGRWVERTK